MSTWGMDAYARRGEPVLRQAIEEKQPALLVANHPLLDPEHAVFPAAVDYRPALVERDRTALEGAFIHHWGPLYVAGKRFEAPTGETPARIDLLIAGPYTLEARRPVVIDGRLVQPGQLVELARGLHGVTSTGSPEPVTLRWGRGLYLPEYPPPDLPLFLGF